MSEDEARPHADWLGRLMRGEIGLQEALPAFLAAADRRAVGCLGMTALDNGRGKDAKNAFSLLMKLEPDVPVHRLMYAHACVLENAPRDAFVAFTEAITLAGGDTKDRTVAAEAWLGRADLCLRLGRDLDGRADLCEAQALLVDPMRRQTLCDHLKNFESRRLQPGSGASADA